MPAIQRLKHSYQSGMSRPHPANDPSPVHFLCFLVAQTRAKPPRIGRMKRRLGSDPTSPAGHLGPPPSRYFPPAIAKTPYI
jgi:hypothetical protein